MLARVLEPEVMDSDQDAVDYDSMDHGEVNRAFVSDLLAAGLPDGEILDLGTGTAQIPLALCRADTRARVLGVDLASSMLALARDNVARADRAAPELGLRRRIELEQADAKRLSYSDGRFGGVMSNSIVHHLSEPAVALAEAVRVTARGGRLFVRDLLRPADEAALNHLVATYAAGANPHQRQLFADSLRAALSLAEMRDLVSGLGFEPRAVRATSDRHWTWTAVRP
jgi:ubiquinone/menaquinone biosynthesis C-methylase UbiE